MQPPLFWKLPDPTSTFSGQDQRCIEGSTLQELIVTKTQFALSDVYDFVHTMLSTIAIAEEKRIVHRDIKPGNIIRALDGKFWLIDFGIARHLNLNSLTPTNAPFAPFTLGYAASEQFRNRKNEIDSRTDLFSVGVVTVEMITGSNPFRANTVDPLQVLQNVEKIPLPLVRIQGDSQYLFATLVKSMGDNRISRRPASAREALTMLEAIRPTLSI